MGEKHDRSVNSMGEKHGQGLDNLREQRVQMVDRCDVVKNDEMCETDAKPEVDMSVAAQPNVYS